MLKNKLEISPKLSVSTTRNAVLGLTCYNLIYSHYQFNMERMIFQKNQKYNCNLNLAFVIKQNKLLAPIRYLQSIFDAWKLAENHWQM